MARPRSAFAKQLAAWMALAELDDTTLARKLRVSKMAVGRWRRGINVPREEKWPALARALNVTVDEISQLIEPVDLLPPEVRWMADKLAGMPPAERQCVVKRIDDMLDTPSQKSDNVYKRVGELTGAA